MAMLVVALLLVLYSFVATCAFVCCDSARSRKAYALAIVIGGLAGVVAAPAITAGPLTQLALRVYWGYEMLKLAKIAEEGSQFAKM